MSSIQTRILILFTFGLSLLTAFSLLTYSTFKSYIKLIDEREVSYGIVDKVALNQNQTLSSNDRTQLETIAQELKPEFRSKALKSALKKPNQNNLRFLIRAENEYRNYITPMTTYLKKRLVLFSTLSLIGGILFALSLLMISKKQIFHPLKLLSDMMKDFLNNRYSYKFSVPEPNEIGELHSTFNELAQKVLMQIEELKGLDKAKSEFLSIASHELRTPLTSIKGSLTLLNSGIMGNVSEQFKSLMGIALEETERLIRIINELLDLAKIEARQFPLNCDWHDIKFLINKTFASLQGFCEQSQVSLQCELANNIDVYVDQDRLQQILTNLLSNAIKFSPPKAKVLITFSLVDAGEVQINVVDFGRGISPEDQSLIFEKFRQSTSSQNPLVKGTGLGLAIAKALVEQHGGQIGVTSMPNQGATFYFTLPKWRPSLNTSEAVA